MGMDAKLLALESHRLSYEYYALSQRRELWTHDVGLFEYDRHGLRYHHLSVSWNIIRRSDRRDNGAETISGWA